MNKTADTTTYIERDDGIYRVVICYVCGTRSEHSWWGYCGSPSCRSWTSRRTYTTPCSSSAK